MGNFEPISSILGTKTNVIGKRFALNFIKITYIFNDKCGIM